MTLDHLAALMFLAGLLTGVGLTLTAFTAPAALSASVRLWRYSRQHAGWGIGFAAIVLLAELVTAAIVFRA